MSFASPLVYSTEDEDGTTLALYKETNGTYRLHVAPFADDGSSILLTESQVRFMGGVFTKLTGEE